ncbi:unnamed protein product [Calicophoron daubneyi]|uniref:5'-AMP-activated protein kinase subunit beta-1 n=1 Tax=Calicophoron daubneyi TaxID=300641 RepID=A0AAV2TVD2_CALDB
MGNTPAHHKRRLSGDGEYRFTGTTPAYLSVTIPPSKRRNMHSLSDLSKSAPPDYSNDPLKHPEAPGRPEMLSPERLALDEATSMLRAASLRDSSEHDQTVGTPTSSGPTMGVGDRLLPGDDRLTPSPHKTRPRSTGCPSPNDGRAFMEIGSLGSRFPYEDRFRPRTCPTGGLPTMQGSEQRSVVQQPEPDSERKCPTVFRWNGGGREIYVSGTFNNWEKRIPMVRRSSGVYVIIDCTPGTHEYKYFIDGAWYHDPTKPTVDNGLGTKNNVVVVKPSDFDVIQALELDQLNSRHRSSQMESPEMESLGHSPPGEYGRYIPSHPSEVRRRSGSLEYRSSAPIAPGIGTINQPPLLPPHLLQGILNMDTSAHCDPNLLPPPNHVIVNHLYALSIKDGVIVLSVITRYRQKFVSTVFYRPIQD